MIYNFLTYSPLNIFYSVPDEGPTPYTKCSNLRADFPEASTLDLCVVLARLFSIYLLQGRTYNELWHLRLPSQSCKSYWCLVLLITEYRISCLSKFAGAVWSTPVKSGSTKLMSVDSPLFYLANAFMCICMFLSTIWNTYCHWRSFVGENLGLYVQPVRPNYPSLSSLILG